MSYTNQQVVLVRYPIGAPKLEDFKLITTAVRDLEDDEILLRTEYISLDPYMRGRMTNAASYVPPFQLGSAIEGVSVSIIEKSKSPDWKVGERVLGVTGWQNYTIQKGKKLESANLFTGALYKIPNDIQSSYFLGVLGMTGFTAYHGLMNIGQPKAGETLVVSAATGAVGSVVGQLAKLRGCRVVGVAGGAQKCQYAIQELGFDACIDHNSKTFKADLKLACPKGVDIYFENVGGPVFWAVFPLLNNFARIPICGAISWYNDLMTLRHSGWGVRLLWKKILALFRVFLRPDKSTLILMTSIGKRLNFQGFIIGDHFAHFPEFLNEMIPLVKSGKIKVKEDIIQGLEQAPEAFIGLLQGKNFGKLIVKI